MSKNIKVYSYYFPNWHVDPKNEKWHGTGWTEWEVVKKATPRFDGHQQPKVPVWGYEDENGVFVTSYGTEAAMPLFHASQKVRECCSDVAKSVFRS